MFSVTSRLISDHLHYPRTDQSLDAWEYSSSDECRMPATPCITRQVVEYRGIAFLEPLVMCSRRNFTCKTDQAKVVLSSTLRKPLGPYLAAAAEPLGPGLQPWCWAMGLHSPVGASGSLAPDQSCQGSSGQSTWVKKLPGTFSTELILGLCADWSASYNSYGNYIVSCQRIIDPFRLLLSITRQRVVAFNGAKIGNRLPSEECSTLGADFLGKVQNGKIFFMWKKNSITVTLSITIYLCMHTFMHIHINKYEIYRECICLHIFTLIYIRFIPHVQYKRYLR